MVGLKTNEILQKAGKFFDIPDFSEIDFHFL